MDKYLLEILKEISTIIIPGLGALTITNKETGEIMFMSYLKHDDGKLSSYIAEKEGWEENDAKNFIAKYVREITTQLDKGDSYDMFQFGSFVKKDDEVDFVNWNAAEGEETETIVAPIVEETKVEIEEETPATVPTIEEVPEIKEESTEDEGTTIKKIESTAEDTKATVEIAPKASAPITEEKELNILEKEERAAVKNKLDSLKKEKNTDKKREKRGAGFWILLVLIVLIVSGGTYVGLNYDSFKQHIPFLADEEVTQEQNNAFDEMKELLSDGEDEDIIEESISEDSTSVEEEEIVEDVIEEIPEEAIPEEIIVPASSGEDLPFHIIAGAFSSEQNANRLGDKLRAEGYSVKVGPGRGMNLVSIKSFATRKDANAALSSLKEFAPNGWVYEWK